MKILLLGDYSGLHLNLAQGLRALGEEVKVASGGDLWKGFERDIDLKQPSKFKRPRFLLKLLKAYPQLCNNDVVQLIGPNPLGTSPWVNNLYTNLIVNHNDKLFLGANGMDYYYCKAALEGKFKYSIFQIDSIKNDPWVTMQRESINDQTINNFNIKLAKKANGITSCAVGYYQAYHEDFPDKTKFIPLPINTNKFSYINFDEKKSDKIIFFIGKMKGREKRKGIDVIEQVLNKLQNIFPNDVEIKVASSVPFKQYHQMMNESHIICDQLYAYGIGMNGLIGQAKGLIACGGADEELYKLLNEYDNRPIIDINTTKEKMLQTFENLIENKKNLKTQSINSRNFIEKHHNYIMVAQQYLDFWKTK